MSCIAVTMLIKHLFLSLSGPRSPVCSHERSGRRYTVEGRCLPVPPAFGRADVAAGLLGNLKEKQEL